MDGVVPSVNSLRKLPRLIAEAEAAGQPVIIPWQGPLPRHVRELFATFGVLVRFLPEDD